MATTELQLPVSTGQMNFFIKDSFDIDVKCKVCFNVSNITERNIGATIKHIGIDHGYVDVYTMCDYEYYTTCKYDICRGRVIINESRIPIVVQNRIFDIKGAVRLSPMCSCKVYHTENNTKISERYEPSCWHCMLYCADRRHHIMTCTLCNYTATIYNLSEKIAIKFRHTDIS